MPGDRTEENHRKQDVIMPLDQEAHGSLTRAAVASSSQTGIGAISMKSPFKVLTRVRMPWCGYRIVEQELVAALTGSISAHHRFILGDHLKQIEHLDKAIERVTQAS